jgi:predicted Zn-dependent protease
MIYRFNSRSAYRDRSFFIVVFMLFGLISCASTNLPSIGELEYLQLHEDEKRLWNRSGEEQKKLDNSGHIYDDLVLTAYVNHVAHNLIPEDLANKGLSIQVRIIKNPLLNAFSYPNGVIYIHTGILSKLENEAQLASILSHEIIHVTHRHTIQNYRKGKNTTAALATIQVGAVSLCYFRFLVHALGNLGAAAAITGYSRELETEADEVGLDLLIKAGYDPLEAPRIFEHFKKDVDQQDAFEPFFFGTHPRLQERLNNYNQIIKTRYAKVRGEKGTGAFMQKIAPVLLDNAQLDLSMGRFYSVQRNIKRYLKINPQNARAHYLLGEFCRQRNDIKNAIEEYHLSISYDPSYSAPHKSLGILYYKQKLEDKSKREFEKYLLLAPNAKDREYIEQYLKDMGQK